VKKGGSARYFALLCGVFEPAWPLAHWLHRSTAVAGATRIEMGRKDPTTAASDRIVSRKPVTGLQRGIGEMGGPIDLSFAASWDYYDMTTPAAFAANTACPALP
jgi:hypothetical protein